MRSLIIIINYISAICAIVLGFLAVDIYSEHRLKMEFAIEENARKTEDLYVALAGRHNIRLSQNRGENNE